MKNPSLSVVIPAFNEESTIGYVLSDAIEHLPRIIKNFEIIVVNDGSTDKTKSIVNLISKKNKRVRLINQRHSGFSKALMNGIQNSKKDYIAYMQGNGQDLIRDMVNSLEHVGEYDLILGVRGRRIDYDLVRLLQSYGGLFLYRILFGIKYDDVHWTYIWKAAEIKNISLDTSGEMFILVESLIKFRNKGLTIAEVTAPYRPRYAGVSRNLNRSKLLSMFNSMINLKWKSIKGAV